MSFSDIGKLCVLFGLLALCFISAVNKFYFAPVKDIAISQTKLPQSFYDYKTCDAVNSCNSCNDKSKMKKQCLDEFHSEYEQAVNKCNGFLKNLYMCQSKRQSGCHAETSNLEGCIKSIVKDSIVKWSNPDIINK